MQRRKLLKIAGCAVLTHVAQPLLMAQHETVKRTVNVRDYGAVGDGKSLDTEAIQKALDACAASGGGTVRLTAGTYLSGSVFLRSHVHLQIDKGATLLGSTDLADYRSHAQAARASEPGTGGHLLNAQDADDVQVTGEGTIDGNGQHYWVPNPKRHKPSAENAWTDVAMFNYEALPHPGPMLNFNNCKRASVTSVRLLSSPSWTVRFLNCDNVRVQGIDINNPRYGLNTDGIDIVCTSNVDISDCHIVTGDDAICLKSEGAADALRPTRNVTVRRCFIDTNCNGLKIGTGSQGAFENIAFHDCRLQTKYDYVGDRMISGIAVEVVDGGSVNGFLANNIHMDGVRTPIFIRLGNRGTGQSTKVPGTLRNVRLSNVTAVGAIATSSICGIPEHPVEDVVLSDIQIQSDETASADWATRVVPELEDGYPEARMFGRLPASGLYCRHAKQVQISRVSVQALDQDFRPTLHAEDVQGLKIDALGDVLRRRNKPIARLRRTRQVNLRNVVDVNGIDAYVEADDAQELIFAGAILAIHPIP